MKKVDKNDNLGYIAAILGILTSLLALGGLTKQVVSFVSEHRTASWIVLLAITLGLIAYVWVF